jgi:hypothetical protein
MRKAYKHRFFLLLIGFGLVLLIAGCVDTSVESIPSSIDYSSQIKTVNLVSGAGTATLTLNGQSLGSADFGSEVPGSQSDFLTIPAGNKILNAVFASADTSDYQFATATERKIRIFLWGTAASNDVVTFYQRYIWQTPGSDNAGDLFPAYTGQVAFFNGSPDAVLLSVTFNGADTTTVDFEAGSGAIESGIGAWYIKLKSGDYSINISYSTLGGVTKDLPAFDYTLQSKARYTLVIYDVEVSLKNTIFVDDL